MNKNFEFYKKFYDENRVALLQYKSLRNNFSLLIRSVLGKNYYNMSMDVYECDRVCCEDIKKKTNRNWIARLINYYEEKMKITYYDIKYPLRLCVEMMHYCVWSNDKTKDLTISELKDKLSQFFSQEQIEESTKIFTDKSLLN